MHEIKLLFSFMALLILISVPQVFAQGQVHVIADTEGSMSAVNTLVEHGKLKWVTIDGRRQLEFTNPNDRLIFTGDLNGPNWEDPAHPRNMEIRDVFMDLQSRRPTQFEHILGNHEYNRLGYIRENILMEKGKHAEYKKWLAEERLGDSTENRVSYWGRNTYGVTKEGIPLPVDQYRKEMTNQLGREVSVKEAAENFAADLRVGKPGEKHGKMLEYILKGNESTQAKGWGLTHAPPNRGNVGVVPGPKGEKLAGGASWLRARNDGFFKPELDKFVSDVQAGRVPSDVLPSLGDARWDSVAKSVVHDAASLSYTERPRVGDRYTGVDEEVARAFSTDPKEPVRGLISGHKPAGSVQTVHRMSVDGKPFLDVVADTSRSPRGVNSSMSILDSGDIEITEKSTTGKFIKTRVGPNTNPLIGMVTEDGFQIKSGPFNGKYKLERYVGYNVEEKLVKGSELKAMKLAFSVGNSATDTVLRHKVDTLSKAIRDAGGEVVTADEAGRFVRDRFVIDMRGATSWSALSDAQIKKMRKDLTELASTLDPDEVVILTGGNRVSNPNAFESVVQDVFAGPEAKQKFDIIGFMKHDTPADEVDSAVKNVVLIGEGNNWDGPTQAALKFVKEKNGASLMVGGGGVLERYAQSETAAGMKDRLFLLQGYGGASEKVAEKGTPIHSIAEFKGRLRNVKPEVVKGAKKIWTPEDVIKDMKKSGKKVVSLVGYSGAGYEDREAMLKKAKEILKNHDPKKTIINLGATEDGIGEIYKVAKEMGFETTGIASKKGMAYGLSPHADKVYFVDDDSWGGFKAGTEELTGTSKAYIGSADKVYALGGGHVSHDEILGARKMGTPVEVYDFDMNHAKAIASAKKAGKPVPTAEQLRGPTANLKSSSELKVRSISTIAPIFDSNCVNKNLTKLLD